MSLTTDPNSPCLKNGQKETGQNDCYLVLSEEERAKGFIRPYRDAYIHVGKKVDTSKMIPVDEYWGDDYKEYDEVRRKKFKEEYGYMYFIPNENKDSAVVGTYITEKDLKKGCGALTTMGRALSETYARNPKFYGATFCTGCNTHLPVAEFVWDADGEVLGS